MKIALLASNPDLYSNQRLLEEGVGLGHDMVFIKVKQCYLILDDGRPSLHYRGDMDIKGVDAVIPRLQPALTHYGTTLVRQFETMGVRVLNSSDSILASRDKLQCLQRLTRAGLPVPKTGFAFSSFESRQMIQKLGGAPVVIKLLEGTHGKGVVLSESLRDAQMIIDAFQSFDSQFLIQEYIKEAQGKDIRCYVIGDSVVAAMTRTAAEGDFRANLHSGGSASFYGVSDEIAGLACKAAKCLGLDVAGVDILLSNQGPVILEVNSSPGLEGIELVSKENIAMRMISYLE